MEYEAKLPRAEQVKTYLLFCQLLVAIATLCFLVDARHSEIVCAALLKLGLTALNRLGQTNGCCPVETSADEQLHSYTANGREGE